PACAAGAAVALGLDPERIATAIALAIPGAGGVQRAFGTDAKSLQAGFAVDARIRAAALAAAGAPAARAAPDAWLAPGCGRARGGAGGVVGPGRVDGPGRRGPGRGGPGRPGDPRRPGHQGLSLLLRAAAPDQRPGRAGGRPRPRLSAPHRAAHAGSHRGP